MKKEGISVEQLLNYLPDSELEAMSESSKVDYQVKRLPGKTVFKLFIINPSDSGYKN